LRIVAVVVVINILILGNCNTQQTANCHCVVSRLQETILCYGKSLTWIPHDMMIFIIIRYIHHCLLCY